MRAVCRGAGGRSGRDRRQLLRPRRRQPRRDSADDAAPRRRSRRRRAARPVRRARPAQDNLRARFLRRCLHFVAIYAAHGNLSRSGREHHVDSWGRRRCLLDELRRAFAAPFLFLLGLLSLCHCAAHEECREHNDDDGWAKFHLEK